LGSHMIRVIYAFSVISGTMIGVGLFALPYLTLKTSPLIMLAYFIILGFVSIAIHYFYAAVALKTPDFIRLPGFARYHLGQNAYRVAIVSGILGLMGANLAYLILGGRFLNSIFFPIFGFGESFYTFIYFALGSILVLFGIKAIGKVHLLGLILFFLSLVIIVIKGVGYIDFSDIVFESSPSHLFLPYGVVLFSLWGLSLIPEAEELLDGGRKYLTKIIPFTVIFSSLIYFVFTFVVLGIMGNETPADSLTGLQMFLGNGTIVLVLLFAVITTFTSYIALGLTLKKMLWYDMGMPKNIAWIIACVTPFLVYLVGFQDFVKVLSLVGCTMLVIDAILVCLMYRKIPEMKYQYLVIPVIIALSFGFLSELINFL